MIKCEICGRYVDGWRGLNSHIRLHTLSAKQYYDKYLKKEGEGICIECGKETNFHGMRKGYYVYCSRTCVQNSKKVKEKKEQTCLKNHGVKNPAKSKKIRDKTKQTNLKKYGVESPIQLDKIKKKMKQTCLEKYGVENPSQTKEIKNKIKQTCLNKYGAENPQQQHINNIDLYYNVGFIKNMFLFENGRFKQKKMSKFFNITKTACYSHLKRLGIEFKYVKKVSHYEDEILEFLQSLNVTNIIQNDRKLICPKELDFYLPDYGLAIEFDGIFWHSEQQGKTKYYHLEKTQACEEKGVQLLHIFENEWAHKTDIIKSMFRSKLGKLKKLCGARQTTIKEICLPQAREFLNKNHRQGYCNCSIKLGAFYKNKLISAMTFAKSSVTKGRKDQKSNNYELSRFCCLLNYQIPGIASKLLSYFKNNYVFNELFTFADRRYSGILFYTKLGFTCCGETAPCHWYFKERSYLNLTHHFNYRKSELSKKLSNFNPNATEYQNMINNRYDRIWDCGNYKFVFKNK